jgi:HK97 family phage major capsid protein
MLHRSVPYFRAPGGEQKAELVGDWFKGIFGNEDARARCIARGVGLTKAVNESMNVTGGFLAPSDYDAAIASVVETFGAYRMGADIRPTRSDGQVRPRRTGGATATLVKEGGSIPESNLLFDAIESAQKKLGILLRSSAELLEDAAPVLAEFLTFEIGLAIAALEDDYGFNADGTSAFAGISGLALKLVGLKSSVAAAPGHNTFLTIDTTDIANLTAGVLATAVPGAAWYTSATGYAQTICRLLGARKRSFPRLGLLH